MAPTKTTEDNVVSFSVNGPALFYISSTAQNGLQEIKRADLDAVDTPRERAICRALLNHALALLNATDPARTHSVSAERR